jgi:hypothetical protein
MIRVCIVAKVNETIIKDETQSQVILVFLEISCSEEKEIIVLEALCKVFCCQHKSTILYHSSLFQIEHN